MLLWLLFCLAANSSATCCSTAATAAAVAAAAVFAVVDVDGDVCICVLIVVVSTTTKAKNIIDKYTNEVSNVDDDDDDGDITCKLSVVTVENWKSRCERVDLIRRRRK